MQWNWQDERLDEKGYGRKRAGGSRLTQRCIYVLLKLQTLQQSQGGRRAFRV